MPGGEPTGRHVSESHVLDKTHSILTHTVLSGVECDSCQCKTAAAERGGAV